MKKRKTLPGSERDFFNQGAKIPGFKAGDECGEDYPAKCRKKRKKFFRVSTTQGYSGEKPRTLVRGVFIPGVSICAGWSFFPVNKQTAQKAGFFLLFCCILLTLFFLGSIVYFIFAGGSKVINWAFLTQWPRNAMTEGGIFPALLGTFYLTLGAVITALPLGLACAVYLCEYTPGSLVLNAIRIGINNLAGVPSVVFGLFGLAVFVKFFGFGVSVLSGSLTLGILILPGVISASQEALMAVPNSLREASLALGATRWQTIKKIVIPHALPGILTGVILSIGRAAGETAPILFTAAAFYTRKYPESPFSEVMALPYHIYALMTEGTHPREQTAIAYGSALVLLILVLLISGTAVFIRQRQRSIHG